MTQLKNILQFWSTLVTDKDRITFSGPAPVCASTSRSAKADAIFISHAAAAFFSILFFQSPMMDYAAWRADLAVSPRGIGAIRGGIAWMHVYIHCR